MDRIPTRKDGQRQKSPNAPAYSIQECLEEARKIYRAENQVPISRESIAEHLNLAAQSGPFNRKLSSLRQYGLLESVGKDLRVTDLFLRIDHATDEVERRRALREALGRPAIFQAILGHYESSGMPSDVNLTNQLILKYRFTKNNAETVAKAILESWRFSGLSYNRPASLPPPALPSPAIRNPESPKAFTTLDTEVEITRPRTERSLYCRQEFPLGNSRRAVLDLPEDINAEEIAKIVRILQAQADTK